jgi:hypothetical protein
MGIKTNVEIGHGDKDADRIMRHMLNEAGVTDEPTVKQLLALFMRFGDNTDMMFRLVANEAHRIGGEDFDPACLVISQLLTNVLNLVISDIDRIQGDDNRRAVMGVYVTGIKALAETIDGHVPSEKPATEH